MAQAPSPAANPWRVGFALALATFLGSLAALTWVIATGLDNDGRSSPATTGPAAPANGPLLYTGDLPSTLDPNAFRAAGAGERPDLAFAPAAPGEGAVVRYFVPVAAFDLGLDALTTTELAAAFRGDPPPGALPTAPGRFQFLAVTGDVAPVRELAGGAQPVALFSDYTALLAAMSPGTNAIGLVPLEALHPSVSALAVDGVDIVRGRGDPASWPFVERVTVTARTRRGEAALPAVMSHFDPQLPAVITIVATGDILQSRCSLAKIEATGDWAAALRGPVGDYLAAADLTLASLDGSIQDIGEPYRCVETTNLTSPPAVIAALTLAGIDEVTVATNHVFDCGQSLCDNRGFLRTLELLHQAGIRTVGGGNNLEEALAPAVFDVGGVRFGVLGFDDIAAYELQATASAPGTAPLDDDYTDELAAGEPAFFRPAEELSLTRFTERIRQLKAQVDVVIVQVQSGTEDTHTPSPRSLKALRAAADAGADLVVGNQAHWVQAAEFRGDAFIAYALGNFVFDQVHTPQHTQGYLLEATFWGTRLAAVRLVPYQIANLYHPEFVTGDLRAKILGDVFAASAALPPP